jgi:ABC-type multidrug transport system fused ATPase/permease subunit
VTKSLKVRQEQISALANTFFLERIFYLIICSMSFVALIAFLFIGLYQRKIELPSVIAYFLPTGGIGWSCDRILKVWTKSIDAMMSSEQNE